jgi:cytochrome c-type biogenesis protein CcmH/NrfG
LVAASILVANIGVGVWLSLGTTGQRKVPGRADGGISSSQVVPRAPRDVGFVDDSRCATCHPEIADSYRHSGMARSWRALHGAPAGCDVTGSSIVDDSGQGYRYRVLLEEGRVVQEETRLDGPQRESHRLRRDAGYSVGSGDHALALLSERNGYLTQLPIAWFAGEQKWKFNPGYELLNRRFDRPITPGCIACHGTDAAHHQPTLNRYEIPIPDGISCQRCHGPGAGHVAYWSARRERVDGRTEKDSRNTPAHNHRMVNPAKLAPGLANDVCLQCHLQGDVTLYQPGHDAFSFRAGGKLSDHRLDFLVKTDKPEAFGVASHGARLMRSRCHLEGKQHLTCIRCHDPHVSIREVSRDVFDARCAECHAPETCRREAPLEDRKLATGCVRCHMPQRATREGQHLVFTEHWIQRRPAPGDTEQPILPTNADVELIPIWPDADPQNIRLASAYVLLHETMGPQNPSLARGVTMLQEAIARGPLDADARYWLASGLISQHQSRPAIGLLQEILRDAPDHHLARFRLGIAYDQIRNYERAAAEYEQLVETIPDWMEPYPLLARLYLFRNEADKAIRLLEQQLSYNPDATTWTYLAAARSLKGVAPADCLELIDKALSLDPRHVPSLLAQGQFRLQTQDTAGAIESFRQVVEIDPENIAARAALQQLNSR